MTDSIDGAFKETLRSRVQPLYDSPLISAAFKSCMFDNPHTDKTIGFGPDFCRPVASKAKIDGALFILFANRSGSSYLAELLRATGRFNKAGEIFNWEVVTSKSNRHGFDSFGTYLDSMKKLAVEGQFACKASLSQFLFLQASSFLESHFPKRTVILTQRDDKIAQAVSLWIAHHTKQWTSEQPKPEDAEVPFDADALTSIVNTAYQDEKNTRVAMSLLCQEYFTANYEDFQAFPDFVVRKILRKCGIKSAPVDYGKIKLKRQAGLLNEELRARYLSHYSTAQSTVTSVSETEIANDAPAGRSLREQAMTWFRGKDTP